MVETEKKRGAWLTIWLVFMLISNFFAALMFLLLNKTIASVYPNVAMWVWYVYGSLSLAIFVFVILLFMWKKWPIFAFIGIEVIVFIMNLVIGLGIVVSVIGLAGPIILYLSMRSRWNLFV